MLKTTEKLQLIARNCKETTGNPKDCKKLNKHQNNCKKTTKKLFKNSRKLTYFAYNQEKMQRY